MRSAFCAAVPATVTSCDSGGDDDDDDEDGSSECSSTAAEARAGMPPDRHRRRGPTVATDGVRRPEVAQWLQRLDKFGTMPQPASSGVAHELANNSKGGDGALTHYHTMESFRNSIMMDFSDDKGGDLESVINDLYALEDMLSASSQTLQFYRDIRDLCDRGAQSPPSDDIPRPIGSSAADHRYDNGAVACAQSPGGLHKQQPSTEKVNSCTATGRISEEAILTAMQKIKEADIKKLFVKVFIQSGDSKTLLVGEQMAARDAIRSLFEKCVAIRPNVRWTLVEQLPGLMMERIIEDHERLVPLMLNWERISDNRILFLEAEEKYDLFFHPQKYLLEEPDAVHCTKEHQKSALLREAFNGLSCQLPDIVGDLHIKIDGQKTWRKVPAILRNSGIYTRKSKTSRDLQCIIQLAQVELYRGFGWRRKLRAPTEHGFALKPAAVQNKCKDIKYFCCDDAEVLQKWLTGIRMAKYGSTLEDNFKQMLDLVTGGDRHGSGPRRYDLSGTSACGGTSSSSGSDGSSSHGSRDSGCSITYPDMLLLGADPSSGEEQLQQQQPLHRTTSCAKRPPAAAVTACLPGSYDDASLLLPPPPAEFCDDLPPPPPELLSSGYDEGNLIGGTATVASPAQASQSAGSAAIVCHSSLSSAAVSQDGEGSSRFDGTLHRAQSEVAASISAQRRCSNASTSGSVSSSSGCMVPPTPSLPRTTMAVPPAPPTQHPAPPPPPPPPPPPAPPLSALGSSCGNSSIAAALAASRQRQMSLPAQRIGSSSENGQRLPPRAKKLDFLSELSSRCARRAAASSGGEVPTSEGAVSASSRLAPADPSVADDDEDLPPPPPPEQLLVSHVAPPAPAAAAHGLCRRDTEPVLGLSLQRQQLAASASAPGGSMSLKRAQPPAPPRRREQSQCPSQSVPLCPPQALTLGRTAGRSQPLDA